MVIVMATDAGTGDVEAIVDRVSLERHPLSKRAKDAGSAAVALSLLVASATWAVVLFNRFY